MIKKILALGNKIEMLEIGTGLAKEPEKRQYVSQLLEFDEEDEDIVYIAMPIYEGRLIPLEVGRRFELYFYAKKGIFACNSEVANRFKSGNVYILEMRILSDLKKHQRRQFYRLEINMPIQYKIFNTDDEKYFRVTGKISDEMMQREYVSGTTIDISGGGSRFVSPDRLADNDKMIVSVNVGTDNGSIEFNAIAKVITSLPVKGRNDIYENRIEFVQVKDSDREKLIKFIFWKERSRIKQQE